MRFVLRVWLPVVVLLMPCVASAQTAADELAQSELARMEGLSVEEKLSRAKTVFTMYTLETLAPLLEAHRDLHGRYPTATQLDEALLEMARPEDKWGTPLRYQVSSDGKRYQLVSAGADRRFDEASWTRPGDLSTDEDDAVLENGKLVRRWTDATRPGAGARGALKPVARGLLEKADALAAKGNHAGALRAYMDAVTADRNAATLEAIRAYAPPRLAGLPAPPPPPPPPGAKEKQPASSSDATPQLIAAWRQFLTIHPGHPEAVASLVALLPPAEAMALADEIVKMRPKDPESFALRGSLYMKQGNATKALADYEQAAALDASNATRAYAAGTIAFDIVTKNAALDSAARRATIARGLAALDRAEALQADYFEALTYRALLLRQLAELESDPAAKRKWIDQADAVRAKAVEIVQKRRAQ